MRLTCWSSIKREMARQDPRYWIAREILHNLLTRGMCFMHVPSTCGMTISKYLCVYQLFVSCMPTFMYFFRVACFKTPSAITTTIYFRIRNMVPHVNFQTTTRGVAFTANMTFDFAFWFIVYHSKVLVSLAFVVETFFAAWELAKYELFSFVTEFVAFNLFAGHPPFPGFSGHLTGFWKCDI